jgi:hypothetical protein
VSREVNDDDADRATVTARVLRVVMSLSSGASPSSSS